MSATTYHLGLDVRGAIHNGAWQRDLVGSCTEPGTGRKLSPREILDALLDCVAAGKHVIPYGEPCDNWDYERGCRGHCTEVIDANA